MENAPRRVIKLSDLPTRKSVREEPITEARREEMFAKSREARTAITAPTHVDATVAAPIHIDTYVSCDVVSVDC